MRAAPLKPYWFIFFAAMLLHCALWLSVRDIQARWSNVPPVPGKGTVIVMALGDKQMANRAASFTLQNLGNTGGRSEPFINYDYKHLQDWLFLTLDLDARSNFVPYMASYYFGASQDPKQIKYIVDYLEQAGQVPGDKKWRWLAEAVFLARYRMNDLDRAYELAVKMASLPDPTLPAWAVQMPAFVMTARGDKEAAYEIMLNILKTSAETMPAQEINFMKHYICDKILEPAQAQANPLCENVQW